jgi:dynein intermediate chain 2
MLFKDPSDVKRSISKVSWCPEGPGNKLAVAYSILRFQKMPDRMPVESYIWDAASPNAPERMITAQSPICTLTFNNKYPDIIVGGSYNGLISFWDLRRRNSKPLEQT